MTPDLDLLERLALAATPGPWTLDMDVFDERGLLEACVVQSPPEQGDLVCTIQTKYVNDRKPETYALFDASHEHEDAAYIAACDPQTILSLIATTRRLEAALRQVAFFTDHTGEHEHAKGPDPERGTSGCGACMAARALPVCDAHPNGCPQDVMAGPVGRLLAALAPQEPGQ